MTRAWRHAETYDPRRGSVATWLLTITRNLSIDSLRLRRAEPIDPGTFLALGAPSSEPTPDEALASADDAVRVRAALAQLPLDQRRAVVLASFQGHTAKEISSARAFPWERPRPAFAPDCSGCGPSRPRRRWRRGSREGAVLRRVARGCGQAGLRSPGRLRAGRGTGASRPLRRLSKLCRGAVEGGRLAAAGCSRSRSTDGLRKPGPLPPDRADPTPAERPPRGRPAPSERSGGNVQSWA